MYGYIRVRVQVQLESVSVEGRTRMVLMSDCNFLGKFLAFMLLKFKCLDKCSDFQLKKKKCGIDANCHTLCKYFALK